MHSHERLLVIIIITVTSLTVVVGLHYVYYDAFSVNCRAYTSTAYCVAMKLTLSKFVVIYRSIFFYIITFASISDCILFWFKSFLVFLHRLYSVLHVSCSQCTTVIKAVVEFKLI